MGPISHMGRIVRRIVVLLISRYLLKFRGSGGL